MKEMKIRIAIEGTSSEDKGPGELRNREVLRARGPGETFRISNFINVKVIPYPRLPRGADRFYAVCEKSRARAAQRL